MYSLPLLILFVFLLSLYLAVKSARSRVAKKEPTCFGNVVLGIRVPKENEKQPLSAEQMFASLHGLLQDEDKTQEHVSFEIASDVNGINFYVVAPCELKEFVIGQVYAQYPQAEITEASDYAEVSVDESTAIAGTSIKLSKEEYFPIRTFRDFEVDPLAAITGSLSELRPGGKIWWQMLVKPVPDVWQEAGHDYVAVERGEKKKLEKSSFSVILTALKDEAVELLAFMVNSIFSPPSSEKDKKKEKKKDEDDKLSGTQKDTLKQIEDKLTKLGFAVTMRVVAFGNSKEQADEYMRRVLASFRQYSASNINSFEGEKAEDTLAFLRNYQNRAFPADGAYTLNTEELASVFHFPNVTVETPAIAWAPAKLSEPPLSLPIDDCTFFGLTTYRDHKIKFGIKKADRRRHMYCVGKTGTGKSETFKTMIRQDMEDGEGVAVIDPHGQLVDQLLDQIPDHRVDDVILVDPSDTENPVALNMLESQTDNVGRRNLLASGLLTAFKKNWEFSWGPRLEYLLNNSILTLVNIDKATMLGITRLLTDKNYRRYITYKIEDPILKGFWETEYAEIQGNTRLATEAVAPIQNKVGRFLSSTTIRNILGQAHSTINLEEIMNTGKILLINLSKGKIGEDNANLLGSLLVSRLNFAAMQRVNIPEEERKDFYLYVDEFQNFAGGDFASILSEARKYRLNLHLTHQYTAQLPEEMIDAVLGNVGTLVSLTLGAPDAEVLAKEFEPVFSSTDLINLEKYNFYVKLMIDGATSTPFSGQTLPPPNVTTDNREKVVELSRRKYGTDVKKVEHLIQRWVSRKFDLGMAKAEEIREKEDSNQS